MNAHDQVIILDEGVECHIFAPDDNTSQTRLLLLTARGRPVQVYRVPAFMWRAVEQALRAEGKVVVDHRRKTRNTVERAP